MNFSHFSFGFPIVVARYLLVRLEPVIFTFRTLVS
ncbi:YvrJ family protein [Desulfofarcimen acetoxidans]